MLGRTEMHTRNWPPWANLSRRASSLFTDIPIVVAGFSLFYGLLLLARYWAAPVQPQAHIDLSPRALPAYALFSLARIAAAYLFSLVFSLGYGYLASQSPQAERFMIPVLDTLQSIPVLSFLPGVMLSMAALFPSTQFGLELGSILLIFTGQVWNMAFSVYSSLKSIPREMLEAARLYRLSRWQRFFQLELPHSAIGLIWNSMMSVAGGWFSLMVCEMFALGNRDLRLPGLGSYLQSASNAGDSRAIAWGLAAMVAVIVLLDQLVWRPAIAWSEKFKFEQVEASEIPRSPVLDFLRRSRLISRAAHLAVAPAREALTLHFARAYARPGTVAGSRRRSRGTSLVLPAAALAVVLYAAVGMTAMLGALSRPDLREIALGAGATFLRVELALALAALWTIPAGIFIGLRPRVSALAQPLAQIAASIPAPALFPVVLMLLIRIGGGLGIASIVLLLLGTQWYILFNVIAGAAAIPSDLKEVCGIFRLTELQRWRTLLLPAVFPYLVTGFVTASGGAWNASIIAEYFHFRGQTFSILGLGAIISRATDKGDFPLLLGATVAVSLTVVAVNRLLWRRLYSLAATKFRLDFS
ncbi:MAG TPA: ABC transporter permease subunit [Bryobacteraceae bacterium]|nr:ABC transporter permease subunit [Bryobacteraceae bacterium]